MREFDFDGCTLLISARSPFARRVRLGFLEGGLSFKEAVVDVFHPTEELKRLNPLMRVPVAVLKDGRTLVESQMILDAFYCDGKSALWPMYSDGAARSQERAEMLKWSGLAVGLCDRIVENYLESVRPKEKQDPEIASDFSFIQNGVLERIEPRLAQHEWIAGGPSITQADFDAGTALRYLMLRYSANALDAYPKCQAYLARLERRASFVKTNPPA